MTSQLTIDTLNRSTMRSAVLEYVRSDVLTPAEAAAVDSVMPKLARKSILDLGVGAGRTVTALSAMADSYVGIDYVKEMVEHCRKRFPNLRFEQADARSMPQFGDASFDLVVFSCNGICMVDHHGRLAILREARRLLRAGGYFIFSSYNRNCPEHELRFIFPDFSWSWNPARLLVRSFRFLAHTSFRVMNRVRYLRHEVRHADYSILNDQCHDYRTLLYYIDIEGQLEQLKQAGFSGPTAIYDRRGQPAAADITEDMLVYVATA